MDFGVAVEKLQSLDSADEVADFLYSQDVKGQRWNRVTCPIATWLYQETGCLASVNPGQIWNLDGWGPEVDIETFTYEPTEAMGNFIRAFDLGKYPNLDKVWINLNT
jgi:hypothetical protein